MTRVLLVPDLPLERWPSMDRYAHRLHDWLESTDPGFEVRLAASIGDLTRDRARSEEHTSELQSQSNLVCRLLLEKKKKKMRIIRLSAKQYGMGIIKMC